MHTYLKRQKMWKHLKVPNHNGDFSLINNMEYMYIITLKQQKMQ